MKRLIAVVTLALATLILTPTTFAGDKDKNYNPSYGLVFVAQNNTAEAISVRVECEKGNFWADLAPKQTFGYGLAYDEPEGGFPPDWFAEGGNVTIYINGRMATTKHVGCMANLSEIVVTIEKKRGPGLKVGVQLTQ